jgi:alkanesulfonate monooxygenase SsuD/methylene tetrahydromethanopterin reductase-like flavin-dependent oxidoreductase (luciferase family)
MRLGIVLTPPFAADAARAEALGFDLVWVDEASTPAPLVTVAGVAATTTSARLAAAVAAGPHPILLAEEAAVADLSSGGRLVLVLAADEQGLLQETVELVYRAWAARPFRHAGARWTVPAGLPEHEHADERVRVTPSPAQLEPTMWLAGRAALSVATGCGLAPVYDGEPASTAFWAAAERDRGRPALGLRRPGRFRAEVDVDGALEVAGLVDQLQAHRDAWGLDVAILELPSGLSSSARDRALRRIATAVRPALTLDRVPDGLANYWEADRVDA